MTIVLAMGYTGMVYAQGQSKTKLAGAQKAVTVKNYDNLQPTGSVANTHQIVNNNNKSTNTVSRVPIGSSVNIFSMLVSQSTCLTAVPDLNMVAFFARSNSATNAGNRIRTSFSSDKGLTFDTTSIESYQRVSGFSARYPSGVLYNPTGNTSVTGTFAVSTAPILTPSAFGGAGFSSIKMDGTLYDEQYTLFTTDTAGGVGQLNTFPRMFLQNRANKFFVLGNANTDDGTNYTSIKTTVNVGVMQADTVAWVRKYITPDFLTSNGLPDGYGLPGIVMDNNGVNGYIVFIGRNGDATDQLTYQPIIYKTTDGGLTWTKDVVFNWGSIAALSYITDLSDVHRPFYRDVLDITMDANGRVHIATFINPAASDNADSLNYLSNFANIKGFVFDTYQTATGWDAMLIDTVVAKDAEDYFTDVDLDERFQMSRTKDGSKIFYAWLDTDPIFDATNKFPDVQVKMYDVASGTLYPKINITTGTDSDADAFWMYLSDYSFDNGNGTYNIPINISKHGASDSDPVQHYFLSNITIAPTGIVENSLNGAVGIYPNPTSDIFNVSFNGVKGNVNVNVYNSIGGLVSANNYAITGAETKTIDLSKMPNGIYMVEISNNSSKVTKKVIKF